MTTNKTAPIMHKLAREIDLREMSMVAGGDTVGTSGPATYIETLTEKGDGPDTVNGKPGTGPVGDSDTWEETYG